MEFPRRLRRTALAAFFTGDGEFLPKRGPANMGKVRQRGPTDLLSLDCRCRSVRAMMVHNLVWRMMIGVLTPHQALLFAV